MAATARTIGQSIDRDSSGHVWIAVSPEPRCVQLIHDSQQLCQQRGLPVCQCVKESSSMFCVCILGC